MPVHNQGQRFLIWNHDAIQSDIKGFGRMRCPHCQCRDIGKIGANQFYCWCCFKEFNVSGEEVRVYDVAEDGSLVSVDNISSEFEFGTGA